MLLIQTYNYPLNFFSHRPLSVIRREGLNAAWQQLLIVVDTLTINRRYDISWLVSQSAVWSLFLSSPDRSADSSVRLIDWSIAPMLIDCDSAPFANNINLSYDVAKSARKRLKRWNKRLTLDLPRSGAF